MDVEVIELCRIGWNSDSGELKYDRDGLGASAKRWLWLKCKWASTNFHVGGELIW